MIYSVRKVLSPKKLIPNCIVSLSYISINLFLTPSLYISLYFIYLTVSKVVIFILTD